MTVPKLVVIWPIMVFDRRKSRPLPYETHFYLLDWTRLSPNESAEIRRLVLRDRPHEHRPELAVGETVVTMSLAPYGHDPRLKQYRRHFRRVDPTEIEHELNRKDDPATHFHTLNFTDEHIENELGEVMTVHEVTDHIAGGPALLMGNAESVLRIGPIPFVRPATWTQRDSNTIDQFLHVITRLWNSDWVRVPVSLTANTKEIGKGTIVHCVFPNASEITSVMSWFRQLYSSDELFVRACSAYLQHIDHPAKRAWLDDIKDSFNKIRRHPPGLPFVKKYACQELIDIFIYGARIMHSESTKPVNREDQLARLVDEFGRENVAFAINTCLRDLLGVATLAYHCIKQDFTDWVNKGHVPKPTGVNPTDLMQSSR